MKIIKMHYLIILTCLTFPVISEAGELWTKYDLPDTINCITSYGDYIWAGTNNGLVRINRLDGSSKTYTTNDGLPTNKVTSIIADKNGIIYAGLVDIFQEIGYNINSYILSINGETISEHTLTSGLRNEIFYPYDYLTHQSVSFILYDNINYYFGLNVRCPNDGNGPDKYIISVIKFDGNNWLNVYYNSVAGNYQDPFKKLIMYNMFLDNSAYPFTVVTDNSKGKLKNKVYDKNGEWDIYFASNYVDYIVNSGTLRYTPENSGLTGLVNLMAIDNSNTKWFGCNIVTSLVSYNGETWKAYRHDEWNNGTSINNLITDEDNCVWAVTERPTGLYRFDPSAITAVESAHQTPAEFTLSSPYPNPFNAQTTISFTLNKPSKVNLSIYSLTGQKVRELSAGNYIAGKHTAVWDSKNEKGETVSSGLYLARMESGGTSKVVRMAMVK